MRNEKLRNEVLYYNMNECAHKAETLITLMVSHLSDEQGIPLSQSVAYDPHNTAVTEQLFEGIVPLIATALQGHLDPIVPVACSGREGTANFVIPLLLPEAIDPNSLPIVDGYLQEVLVQQLCAEWLLLRQPALATPFLQRAEHHMQRAVAVLHRRHTPLHRPQRTL